jgi:hypothetical protein
MECFFCHGREESKLNKEHFLSNPICDLFGIDRKTTHLGRVNGNTNEIQSVAPLEQTSIKLPCTSCNSGWMSDLENTAVQVLDRWINDNARLSPEDLTTLRRWMAKTHLVLCAMEGSSRRFGDDPNAVIPDATLGRLLYEGSDEAFDGVHFAVGIPIKATFLYGFGNPIPTCTGPTPINSRAATVSYLNLGTVQLWTLATTLRPASFMFPPRLTLLRRRLAHRQLQTVTGNADPLRATINYGNIDINAIINGAQDLIRLQP